jgi:hypothetical protein
LAVRAVFPCPISLLFALQTVDFATKTANFQQNIHFFLNAWELKIAILHIFIWYFDDTKQ